MKTGGLPYPIEQMANCIAASCRLKSTPSKPFPSKEGNALCSENSFFDFVQCTSQFTVRHQNCWLIQYICLLYATVYSSIEVSTTNTSIQNFTCVCYLATAGYKIRQSCLKILQVEQTRKRTFLHFL